MTRLLFFAIIMVAPFSTSATAQWPPNHTVLPDSSDGFLSEGGLGECPPGYGECQLATLAPKPPSYDMVIQINSSASQVLAGGTINISLWLAEPDIYAGNPRVDINLLALCDGEPRTHIVYKHNIDDGLPLGWRSVEGTLPNWEPCSQYILWLGHLIGDQQPPFPKVAKIDLEAFRFLWPEMPVAVEPETPVSATTFTLSGPNPFRGATSFSLELAEPARVSVAVYDLLGREVAVLRDGLLPAGRHTIRWEPQGLPSGAYLVRWGADELMSGTKLVTLVE